MTKTTQAQFRSLSCDLCSSIVATRMKRSVIFTPVNGKKITQLLLSLFRSVVGLRFSVFFSRFFKVSKIWKETDADGSGELDFKEFSELMKHAYFGAPLLPVADEEEIWASQVHCYSSANLREGDLALVTWQFKSRTQKNGVYCNREKPSVSQPDCYGKQTRPLMVHPYKIIIVYGIKTQKNITKKKDENNYKCLQKEKQTETNTQK